ncbi:membrane protein [Rhodopirellula sallentina SM41]|uniref:Membrane protein n=1 Tax=Rhodopirellula sallentina SM41 TaxID=1263870 RepID=M5UL78_9BACT|nr:membrane protein [Rhodopirellula sallentina SM41]
MTTDRITPRQTSRSDTSHNGITLQSLRRFTATFGLWALGVVAIGVTAIFAARSSDRIRFWLGVTAFVVFILYGLYDLGLFHG